MPVLLAPAKVNLTLEVLAKRADGYHGIRSLMVPLALYDRLTVEPSAEASFACDDASLEDDNLVLRAWEAAGCAAARIRLEKHIPTGAGLGGGSSDAAAVLCAAMDRVVQCAPTAADWLAIARSIGSDVPFFLLGTAALVEGTGERLTALGVTPAWWCVVVEPDVRVNTGEAYRLLDEAREHGTQPSRSRSESLTLRAGEALQRADFATVAECLHNDFEPLVLAASPAVAAAHRALRDAGARNVLLSGSGGCSFALLESEAEARDILERVPANAVKRRFVAPFHCDARWRDSR